MKYLKPEKVIAEMLASPTFSSFAGRIYDIAPANVATKPYITVDVISDVNQSNVDSRARLEVRVIFGSDKKQYEARQWIETLTTFFCGNIKKFSNEEVYMVDIEEQRLLLDTDNNRIVLCDFYFSYLRI